MAAAAAAESSSTADYGEDGPLSPMELAADQPQERRRRRRRRWLQPQKHADLSPKNFRTRRAGRRGARAELSGPRLRLSSRRRSRQKWPVSPRWRPPRRRWRNKTVPEQVGAGRQRVHRGGHHHPPPAAPNKPVRLARPRFFQRCLEKKDHGVPPGNPDVAFLDADKYTDDELRAAVVAISYVVRRGTRTRTCSTWRPS